MKRHWLTALIFLFFIAFSVTYYHNVPGDDLSSSYIACRLLVEGKQGRLYIFDPEYFHIVDDPVWVDIAQETSFHGFLHPYVQTPLWAYILQPLCKNTNFQNFNLIFLIINFSSIAAIVWLVARYWAPVFLDRLTLLVGAMVIFFMTTPAYYTAYLNQTHPLILFITILAVLLASQQRAIWAGLALAMAASVKLTPALIAVFWLVSRRRKPAFSFLIWSLVLGFFTFFLLGQETSFAFLSTLNRISNVLLVSYNNQSLAAWLYSNSYHLSDVFNWRIYPLPIIAKILGLCSMGLIILYIAMMYRQKRNNPNLREAFSISLLLIASTIFSSIAWTHYYIFLVVPLLILVNQGLKTKSTWFMVVSCIIVILNVWPIAINPVMPDLYPYSIIRSHFYSAMICLFALLIISRRAIETV